VATQASLFGGVLARGGVAACVADDAWITAMLQAEGALAQVLALTGRIDQASADAIEAACARPFSLTALGAGWDPVATLPFTAAAQYGITSQDILDTAGMLVAARALRPLLADLAACGPHPGVEAARRRLDQVQKERLAVQLGDAGPDEAEEFATLLGLAAPPTGWRGERTRIADLACALGTAAGAVAAVAADLEPATEAAACARGCAAAAPGLVAGLLTAVAAPRRSAAGAWLGEWWPLRELFTATGSATSWLRVALA
jgi:3-carboxy-cis,cis-muconate cycloisomerase